MSLPSNQTTTKKSPPSLQLVFEVRDTGIGIAQEEMEQLFLPFEQTSSGRATRQGTGLGLSITREFLHRMGGDITVESQVNQGSCFRFYLPVCLSEAIASSWPSSNTRVVGIADSKTDYRILVVDDLPDNLQLLSELLLSVGFSVQQASNGAEAVEICQQWTPHFIWMDLLMPVMDGYEAFKQIRTIQTSRTERTTPARSVIVALTASVLTEKKAEILASGFDDYMVKPYKIADIWSALRRHLNISFIYESPNLPVAHPKQSKSTQTKELSEEAIAALPSEWTAELRQAATQLKGKQVQQLIEQIRPQYPDLARQLSSYSEAYQFHEICDWISSIATRS